MMKSGNPIGMMENLVKNNPQMQDAWNMAQQLSKNNNKEEVLQQIAQQKGVTVESLKEQITQLGFNI